MSVSTFGSPDDPAVLLIHGAGASMDWWAPEFCRMLVDRYVIRYDHRDTGDAPSYPPGEPGYTGTDLVTDAVSVLDSLSVAAAHVVGISMGGGIAQEIALYHPSRVLSLTVMSTTAGAGDADLPGVTPVDFPPEPDWADESAVVEYLVASQRAVSAEPFAEAEIREIATIAVSRTANHESSQKNHFAAPDDGRPVRHRLPEITVPTLVLHGDSDPLLPLPHGEALAREIPGARLVVLPNTGHEFPSRNWPLVAKEVLALTASR
ncbi:alpha/beta fold hydrolase [Actinophytocola algeriensis]|uniref:Pimeloyl-ACP methyl ester carboxylesterase n=1 Tax=Actinophytocola algeriensis TaxID=1768010 RepID=A0A7W7QFP2_9PSEU|nr:alpha/beta hydrolase [Actinophytocola algeriensis]MBB4912624.1 pimeloyl-ACP methyl ester carboxylesterase [Actinophytocola algeriensis]MBE1478998.1 pimeloyl-ACP methyl ester carboxylesterase [Actinophytocola algeriensis]